MALRIVLSIWVASPRVTLPSTKEVVMKAHKALKRLAKIEELISDVAERYSSGASHIRHALHEARAVIGRVKEAVSSEAKRKKAAAKKAAAPAPAKKKRYFSAAQRDAAAERMRQRWAVKKKAAAKSAGKAK
jgi:hypothetical protein